MRKNKLLLLLALLLTAATGAWAANTVTWTAQNQLPTLEGKTTATIDGVTITTPSAITVSSGRATFNGATFSVTEGNITKIVLKSISGVSDYPTGWTISDYTDATWTGSAKSVSCGYSGGVYSIEFTIENVYTVTMAKGTVDATNWTINPAEAAEGTEVTLQYNGRLKVKGVKATSEAAPTGNSVDLSTLTADYEAQDGETLTGTLAGNYKISIADGATVTLDGVTINGVNDLNYEWAGITCLGDATIILSGTNTVKGFDEDYPGIQAAADKTLIINGTGSLTASSYGYAAAIGGKSGVACGNIEIQGGTITATSGDRGAGIGGGYNAGWGDITISGGTVNATGGEHGAGIGGGRRATASFSCGNITISGGTITATGGADAAGIGGGRGNNNNYKSSCGTITITSGVTKVTATMGDGATNSIGAGKYCNCGTVTIGGVVGAISTSPYTYEPGK